jgi:hypothetical protein
MATWYDTSALDTLLERIAGTGLHSGVGAITVRLLDTYTQGDNFAEVNTQTIAQATISTGDFTGPVASGLHRRLTFSGKTSPSADSNSSAQNLHIALCSGTVVLAVTDETSDQPITAGNPVTFPSFYMQSSQPTQVA